MEEIVESLNSLGYQGDCLNATVADAALQEGLNSLAFRALVAWIANELTVLLDLGEQIQPDSAINEFSLELSSFLKELPCSYPALISGPIASRYATVESRLTLLNYLITELMAAKMCHILKPEKQVVIEILESPAAVALKSITQSLNLGKPPQNITPNAFFEKLFNRFNEVAKQKSLGKPLFAPSKQLSFEQWNKLEKLQRELDTEYNLRREMLITRLDVTVQSFQWSDAAKTKEDKFGCRYSEKRKQLDALKHGGKSVDLIELLAARDDLLHLEKTSSASVRENTKSDLQKHIIGLVPDRGGRANEHAPPPPEMPSWQKNRSSGPTGGGGGRGGGHRGGNNQGFYNNQRPQQQRNYQNSNNNQQQDHGSSRGYNNPNNSSQYQQSSSGGGGGGGGAGYQYNRGGNSRVQGGWSQQGDNRDYGGHRQNSGGNNYYNSGGGGGNQQTGYKQNQDGGYNSRGGSGGGSSGGGGSGGGYSRGQSNYNRGGRR